MTTRWRLWLVLMLRSCLFVIAVIAMAVGASREFSPLPSTGLLTSSLLVFTCYRSSPVRRAVGRGLRLRMREPQNLVRGGTSITSGSRDEPAAHRRAL